MSYYQDSLANQAKLPAVAYLDNSDGELVQGGAPVLRVDRGEAGYTPLHPAETAAELNAALGVTDAQLEAMFVGSMFGWHCPGANPDRYL